MAFIILGTTSSLGHCQNWQVNEKFVGFQKITGHWLLSLHGRFAEGRGGKL